MDNGSFFGTQKYLTWDVEIGRPVPNALAVGIEVHDEYLIMPSLIQERVAGAALVPALPSSGLLPLLVVGVLCCDDELLLYAVNAGAGDVTDSVGNELNCTDKFMPSEESSM